MSAAAQQVAPAEVLTVDDAPTRRGWFPPRIPNPLPVIESMLKRDEADIILVAGNVALVALAIIEWPVALVAVGVHAVARTRIKALEAISEVVEEAD